MGVAAVEGLQGAGQVRQLAPGQGLRHAQAHDRPRPARGRQQRRPGAARRARAARDLLPAVPRGRARTGDRRGDAVATTRSTASRATPTSGCSATCCAANGASTGDRRQRLLRDRASWPRCTTSRRTSAGAALLALRGRRRQRPARRRGLSRRSPTQVQAGRIPMALIDRACARMLASSSAPGCSRTPTADAAATRAR